MSFDDVIIQNTQELLFFLLHLTCAGKLTWECQCYIPPTAIDENDEASTEIVHSYDIHTMVEKRGVDLKIIERKQIRSRKHDISIIYDSPWTKELQFETVLIDDAYDGDLQKNLLKSYKSNLILIFSVTVVSSLRVTKINVSSLAKDRCDKALSKKNCYVSEIEHLLLRKESSVFQQLVCKRATAEAFSDASLFRDPI